MVTIRDCTRFVKLAIHVETEIGGIWGKGGLIEGRDLPYILNIYPY